MARRQARELAFRTLFQAERGGLPVKDVWQEVREAFRTEALEVEEALGPQLVGEDIAFAERLIDTYAQHQDELDKRLDATLEGWTFSQMAQTDLNVLRLALTELTYEDLPKEVTIEVAIRIAKKYGGEESGRFVNGVLARLVRNNVSSSSGSDKGSDEKVSSDEVPG